MTPRLPGLTTMQLQTVLKTPICLRPFLHHIGGLDVTYYQCRSELRRRNHESMVREKKIQKKDGQQ